jgi:flagellar motor component MotA
VGAILMLREMESVLNQDTLFPAIAISLITLFYGIILYMLCLVSKSRIERRLVE